MKSNNTVGKYGSIFTNWELQTFKKIRLIVASKERYHRCMAAANEVLKVFVESEEGTSLFIEKVSNVHNEMIQKLSATVTGKTVTCCLPLESRKSAKRKKTFGYI